MLWKLIIFVSGALSLTIDQNDLKQISYSIADQLLCGCIVMIVPSKSSIQINVMELGREIAHGEEYATQLTSYSFDDVERNIQTCYKPLYIVMEDKMTRSELEMVSKVLINIFFNCYFYSFRKNTDSVTQFGWFLWTVMIHFLIILH